ncbi:Hemolysin-type calcium-binding repeat (2 copies) [Seminavis robusta]|uniref:Hemolysin-type calcium-binding repeat (2 copies) n=1 Tax=Seminavis robusta TaxID=568900 RepID=A0A9N8EDV4_9STRA|nr:Hemolysin-type calcium-binding repeat (2 copies) [Seminavis robusta]|eukprot:Sro946_g223280.1 Hemolysin-type calcium-binding repeat (2 copies) (418) ;mRNA; r:23129-24382
MRRFILSKTLILSVLATLPVTLSSICVLCENGVQWPFHIVDPHGTTCIDQSLQMAITLTDTSPTCHSQIQRFHRICCDSQETPPIIAQAPTPAPTPIPVTGKNLPCDICWTGDYPGNTAMVINMLNIGYGSCAQFYKEGQAGNIPNELCDTLQYFAYEPCGCGEFNTNLNLNRQHNVFTSSPTEPVPTTSPPTLHPSSVPSWRPSDAPSSAPSALPSMSPSSTPSTAPSLTPSESPSLSPSAPETDWPTTTAPSETPAPDKDYPTTISVSDSPTTIAPSETPGPDTDPPSVSASDAPTALPSETPAPDTYYPTISTTPLPTSLSTIAPSEAPSRYSTPASIAPPPTSSPTTPAPPLRRATQVSTQQPTSPLPTTRVHETKGHGKMAMKAKHHGTMKGMMEATFLRTRRRDARGALYK